MTDDAQPIDPDDELPDEGEAPDTDPEPPEVFTDEAIE